MVLPRLAKPQVPYGVKAVIVKPNISGAAKTINDQQIKRTTDRELWTEWYDKPLNKIRAWAASVLFGKKGWKLFHQSYYQTAIDVKVRQIEHDVPKTWLAAVHQMPDWIQLITEKEHKGTL